MKQDYNSSPLFKTLSFLRNQFSRLTRAMNEHTWCHTIAQVKEILKLKLICPAVSFLTNSGPAGGAPPISETNFSEVCEYSYFCVNE